MAWFDALRPVCEKACGKAEPPYGLDAVLFYLARWCQKKARTDTPDLGGLDRAKLRRVAENVVRNLHDDGPLVERLLEGADARAWADLRGVLLASARRTGGARADEFADEARQRIGLVLLTGTPPSRAAERLERDLRGPRNEYVFQSPFELWARAVVLHLIVDERRREAKGREPPPVRAPARRPHLEGDLLGQALTALPGLADAIRELPPKQRCVMVLTLSRRDLDQLFRERLCEIAPDLFAGAVVDPVASDREIAERAGTTPRSVVASRSLARRKLAERDSLWELLLDELLPHRSTRPLAAKAGVEDA